MLLFKKAFFEGLKNGSTTLTFRRWQKPKVKPGGRYRCHPIGVLGVDEICEVRVRDITEADARLAGHETRAELLSYLAEYGGALKPSDPVYRVKLHFGGDGDRVEGALNAELTAEDRALLEKKLAGMDERSPTGPWTSKTLKLIAKTPRIAASKLAPKLRMQTLPFKANVVKLKKLGLTQSFEVGYELSPRGKSFLGGVKRKKQK